MKAQTIATAFGLFISALAQSVAINGVSGETQPRLEVRQLATTQPEQWDLFVLAMQQWQGVDNNETTSYYQVAGIHGVPRVSWDGVEPCNGCQSSDGYCTHDSVLFPAWHRTYVALFEQQLVAIAQSIASSYPASSRSKYQAAASALRMPYWDWAAKACSGSVLPTSISGTQITVTGPNGQQTLDNPLYSYTFEDPSNLVYSPFTTWDRTLRYPNSDDSSATSQEQSAINAFENIQPSLQDQVYQMFSTCDDYLAFSNDASSSAEASCAISLEAVHNTVHGTLGGPASGSVSAGHMTYLPLAGFDPVFWLHHVNVDRLFALWQTLHPDSYGATQTAPHTTWAIEQGSTQGVDSPLEPFHKDTAGDFWTTSDVRDWSSTFHYTYPEFVSTDGSQSAISGIVNSLYGPNANMCAGQVPAGSDNSSSTTTSAKSKTSASQSGSSSKSSATASAISSSSRSGSDASTAISASFPSVTGIVGGIFKNATNSVSGVVGAIGAGLKPYVPVTLSPKFVAPTNGSAYQYVANCESQRYGLNGSYYIMLFNGQPASEDVSSWFTDSNLIGLLSFIAGGDMVNTLLATGAVPLTRTLQKLVTSGAIADMSEDSCVPWLKEHLVWKIIGPNGEAVEPTDVPGFKVSVYSSTSTNAGSYSLPQWSSFLPHYQVTENKSGGASAASPLTYNSGSSTGSGSGSGSSSGSASNGGSSESAPSYSSGSGSSSSGVSAAASPTIGSGSTGSAASSAEGAQNTYVGDDDVTTITIWTTETATVCPCATAAAF
ncbi:hypothetical protein DOTSEDRAFT_73923 [Dothistroma septosporum NZE10]|uniref:tyrosinase n=1 Tax=Dothistroma septosporum (strain NZE10 / CBS 128990) TaxID=675120 RepID=N1PJH7_DOTSN|nr:hypothetical protein DOTSEDRAFT_73923 [Dothistroma septosporum NZE10]